MQKIIFLGTPSVAALALKHIHENLQASEYQIIAVISQAPARNERGGSPKISPVHAYALVNNIKVITPESARDLEFLQEIKNLQPDLCITAAYGNVLPQAFLDIPKYGTVNIHPSLLPKYRGAAPVQRTLEDGSTETGVTLCFTVLAMDAGAIISQIKTKITPDENANDLLNRLFILGSEELVKILPQVFAETLTIREQDHSLASHAKKLKIEEAFLNFSNSAMANHNKVRAFSLWPGTKAKFLVSGLPQEIKIIKTRIPQASEYSVSQNSKVFLKNDAINIVCAGGSILEILELQAPGKKILSAKDFWNGLRDKNVEILAPV